MTDEMESMTSQLFEGVVEPSDAAYDDIFVKGTKADMRSISLFSSQEQSYSDELDDFTITFYHEVYYKGEVICKLQSIANQGNDSGNRSTCRLAKGRLEILIEQHSYDTASGRRKSFKQKKQLELDSLVRGSAAAYQLYAADDEIQQNCREEKGYQEPASRFIDTMISLLS
jgi:hypothetical protein